jgi:hypothetical protein
MILAFNHPFEIHLANWKYSFCKAQERVGRCFMDYPTPSLSPNSQPTSTFWKASLILLFARDQQRTMIVE